jgi:hypothetical protein
VRLALQGMAPEPRIPGPVDEDPTEALPAHRDAPGAPENTETALSDELSVMSS